MKNILISNTKGGVGKSLIADELTFSFERTDIPYNFYDLDSQGGTLHRTSKKENAIVSVIDTPATLELPVRTMDKFSRLDNHSYQNDIKGYRAT